MNSRRSTRKNRVLRNTRGRFLAKQPRNSKGRYTYRVKRGGGSKNCQDMPCMYSSNGQHDFGMVAWRWYRCKNKNEQGEQCPCAFND
jgi:hypothetical protein